VLSWRLLSAHKVLQVRQVTDPVALAFVAVQLVQCRCTANSPSSAQVKIMLAGRATAGPCPHTSTAGVVRAASLAAALAGADSARTHVSAARMVSP
jgi:hypothetical protein